MSLFNVIMERFNRHTEFRMIGEDHVGGDWSCLIKGVTTASIRCISVLYLLTPAREEDRSSS